MSEKFVFDLKRLSSPQQVEPNHTRLFRISLKAGWRCFDYEDLLKRDKLSLDLFRIKDKSLTDTDSLPAPDVLAAEIADELEAALEQFTKIAVQLGREGQSGRSK